MAKYTVPGYTTPSGINSREQVMAMQRKLGVTADGIWGPNTQAAYEKSLIKTPMPSPSVKPSQMSSFGYADGGNFAPAVPKLTPDVTIPAIKPVMTPPIVKPSQARGFGVADGGGIPNPFGDDLNAIKLAQKLTGQLQTGQWDANTQRAMVEQGFIDPPAWPGIVKPGQGSAHGTYTLGYMPTLAAGLLSYKMFGGLKPSKAAAEIPNHYTDGYGGQESDAKPKQSVGDQKLEAFIKKHRETIALQEPPSDKLDEKKYWTLSKNNDIPGMWSDIINVLSAAGLNKAQIQQRLQVINAAAACLGNGYTGCECNVLVQKAFAGVFELSGKLSYQIYDYFADSTNPGQCVGVADGWEKKKPKTLPAGLLPGDIIYWKDTDCGSKSCKHTDEIHHLGILLYSNGTTIWVIDSMASKDPNKDGVRVREFWGNSDYYPIGYVTY